MGKGMAQIFLPRGYLGHSLAVAKVLDLSFLIFIKIWEDLGIRMGVSRSHQVMLVSLDLVDVRGLPSHPTPDFGTLYTPLHLR